MRWPEVRTALAAAERWLLPPECLLCHEGMEPSAADALVCPGCVARWSPLPQPQCPRCGQPLTSGVACRICLTWPSGLHHVRSAVWLDGGAREVVHLFKYAGWRRLAAPMGEVMRRTAPAPPGTLLVPVPLGASRARARGYNQSAELATELARCSGAALAVTILRRRRETTSQTALTPEQRRANLRGAFAVTGRLAGSVTLVDDVFTTGATLAEAAVALLEGGAASVSGITFARAPRPLAGAEALSTGSKA